MLKPSSRSKPAGKPETDMDVDVDLDVDVLDLEP